MDEDLIKNEKQFYYHNENLRFSPGTLVITLLCVVLIIVATFTQLQFIHHSVVSQLFTSPYDFFIDVTKHFDTVRKYLYIPQIPIMIFIAAILGRKYGMIAVGLYILLGLTFFPIFAFGGGITYVAQYNFGYILAYPLAVYIAGGFLKNEFTLLNTIKAVFLGVLTIHIIGALYFMLILFIKQDPFSYVGEVFSIRMLSKIAYDLLFSFFAVFIARVSKIFLWFALG